MLRITLETLAKTAKHADASRAAVTLSYTDTEIAVDVRDNGRGLDPARAPQRTRNGGFGLTGMRDREERVAGSLAVESEPEPGLGTAVSARLPPP